MTTQPARCIPLSPASVHAESSLKMERRVVTVGTIVAVRGLPHRCSELHANAIRSHANRFAFAVAIYGDLYFGSEDRH